MERHVIENSFTPSPTRHPTSYSCFSDARDGGVEYQASVIKTRVRCCVVVRGQKQPRCRFELRLESLPPPPKDLRLSDDAYRGVYGRSTGKRVVLLLSALSGLVLTV